MDKELSDEEFVGCLERAGILKVVVISRTLRVSKMLRVSTIWYAVGAPLYIPFFFLLAN